MKKIALFLFIACSNLSTLLAQQASENNELKIWPPSPSVAELGRYGLASAKLSDGSFETQIPLYEYKTKNLTLPISLFYSTNGLKVDKVASRVGMDWNLNVGGSIGRMVLGDPDELKPWVVYPKDFPNTQGKDLTSFISNTVSGNVETTPDVYSYNFNGNSGRFLYLNYQIIKLEQNSLDIKKTNDGFEIIDNNGIKYIFSAKEKSLSYSSCGGHPYLQAGWIDNAWMLTRIVHPFGDCIFIEYKPCEFTYSSSVSQTFTSKLKSQKLDPPDICFLENCNVCPAKTVFTNCVTNIKNNGLLIDKIYSNYRGYIQFNYIPRLDVIGDFALSSITVFDASINRFQNISYFDQQPKKTISFEYAFPTGAGYSGGAGVSVSKRMFLSTLQICGPINDQYCKNYNFDYNKINELPPRLSYAQDHFGFFNGKNNKSLIPPPDDLADYNYMSSIGLGDRLPDWNYALKGTLSKITYPTGGFDSIVYEPHSIYKGVGNYDCNSFNITNNVSADGNSDFKKTTKYFSDTFTVHCDQKVNIEIANIPLSGTIDYPMENYGTDVCLIANSEVIPLNPKCVLSLDLEKNSLQVGPLEWKIFRIKLEHGTYRLMVSVKGPARGYAKFTYRDNNDASGNLSIAGLRVQKVVTKAMTQDIPLERKYYYHVPDVDTSTGQVLVENPIYNTDLFHIMVCQDATDIVNTYVNNICGYNQYFSNSFYNLYLYSGNHIYYKTVTEDLGNNFSSGCIVHDFKTVMDSNALNLVGTPVSGTPLSNYGIMNGLESTTKYYKKNGNKFQLLKQVDKHYLSDSLKLSDHKFYTFNADLGFGTSITEGVMGYLGGYHHLHVAKYNMLSRWIYPDSTIITEFNDSGYQIKTITIDSFNNPNHQQITSSTIINSTNKKITSRYYYPLDSVAYSDLDAIAAKKSLENLHIYNTPLRIQQFNDTALIKETENQYNNNLFSVPVLNKIYHSYNNASKELHTSINKYGRGGNIEELVTKDLGSAYLYDYLGAYPIAEVKNALANDIAYTSFEADGKGNWNFNGVPYIDSSAPTGIKAYMLNADSVIKNGLDSSKTYIVSYWSKGNSYQANGNIGNKGLSMRGWTYYEHKVDKPKNGNILLTGMGSIDELKLYPIKAQMTTYTYDPLIGITSQCDINNTITYYEYNPGGKLSCIKDQNKNIIKLIDYQFQASNGCPVNSCVGLDKRLINCTCETGTRVNTSSVRSGGLNWTCTYHYEWSDGFKSPDYSETNRSMCPIKIQAILLDASPNLISQDIAPFSTNEIVH